MSIHKKLTLEKNWKWKLQKIFWESKTLFQFEGLISLLLKKK